MAQNNTRAGTGPPITASAAPAQELRSIREKPTAPAAVSTKKTNPMTVSLEVSDQNWNRWQG